MWNRSIGCKRDNSVGWPIECAVNNAIIRYYLLASRSDLDRSTEKNEHWEKEIRVRVQQLRWIKRGTDKSTSAYSIWTCILNLSARDRLHVAFDFFRRTYTTHICLQFNRQDFDCFVIINITLITTKCIALHSMHA